ncbi:MAG: penicillin acylase family protein [Devosia sp.]|uniref:penicillin acylase family protein n=1 Tax=Devosia sp. TaxID=1871048 RepID=UPI001A4F0BCC|nr:penicillin acylase family protein [Devosia sp.]MBL8600024.1 penicillin acylase family protein [Devosia sp.]
MREETLELDGLAQPAEIIIDRWGIPHIRAEGLGDLFLVQGFNAARDRLWQLDLWRKRGLGELSADFGPGYLEQDRAARLFLYRGDMQAEWACYSDDAQQICESFVSGVNAYVELCRREPSRLPPEFGLLGTSPTRWRAEDVVRIRSHSWMRNALSEVLRSNILAGVPPEIDALRQRLQPAHDPRSDGAADIGALPVDCLDVFKLAIAPVSFSHERLAAGMDDAVRWRNVTPLGDVLRESGGQGSNNWAIHGSRTATGRPILASDPHRMHALPSLRYIVHLSCPEFDGIGAGEPALPGICIGHNGTAAFGLTLFFGHDQEDVYVYEMHPDDPDRYRYGDDWLPFEVISEPAALPGGQSTDLKLKFTVHGPIIAEYPEQRRAVGVRTVWTAPGTAPYFRSIATMRAQRFEDFRDLLKGWGVPATSQVYADVGGTIGWSAAGFSPVRSNWDGLLPVKGDGTHEWSGYLDPERLPWSCDPTSGYVATANEMNVPSGWPGGPEQFGYEWYESSRADRIAEVLSASEHHNLVDSQALQTDVYSKPAERLLAMLATLRSSSEARDQALRLLQEWDCQVSADSPAAALFEIWWSSFLRPALIRRLVPSPELTGLFGPGDPAGVLAILEQPQPLLITAERDAMLGDTLEAAYMACRERLGPNAETWRWGNVHAAYFEHPAGRVSEPAKAFDIGPIGVGGSDSVPMNMSYRLGDYRLTIGASFRMVIDVGAWDNSVCVNTPGQSGDPRSPHFDDLATTWAAGDYVPLLYSRKAVDAASEHRILLQPRPSS